jgi:hypothetical protein
MKKPSRAIPEDSDDLRPQYRFDYAASRPNTYAALLEGRAIAVVLDPEVAAGIPYVGVGEHCAPGCHECRAAAISPYSSWEDERAVEQPVAADEVRKGKAARPSPLN